MIMSRTGCYRFLLSLLVGLALAAGLNAQEKVALSGTIRNARSGETIIGATIRLADQSAGWGRGGRNRVATVKKYSRAAETCVNA